MNCSQDEGIAFVSRKSGENGIAGYVREIPGITPALAGELTCALSGNGVLSTFIQERRFYTAYHVARLKPRTNLPKQVLLFYCNCIPKNRYRYSYGRQANRTLRTLKVPSLDEIPKFVFEVDTHPFDGYDSSLVNDELSFETNDWKAFRYDDIFEICKGYYNKKPPISLKSNTTIPFIGATEYRNGVTSYIEIEDLEIYDKTGKITKKTFENKIFKGNCLTISNNGSVGEAFFQEREFTCSHDVNPVYLKDKTVKLTKYLALFLAALIKHEKYRWGYGRKWRPIRMPSSIIHLPVDSIGDPDWDYMESYIKTLKYSINL